MWHEKNVIYRDSHNSFVYTNLLKTVEIQKVYCCLIVDTGCLFAQALHLLRSYQYIHLLLETQASH